MSMEQQVTRASGIELSMGNSMVSGPNANAREAVCCCCLSFVQQLYLTLPVNTNKQMSNLH